jgi:hypothetical protein
VVARHGGAESPGGPTRVRERAVTRVPVGQRSEAVERHEPSAQMG